jgi:glutamate dehydrogenase (NAD(P)+)
MWFDLGEQTMDAFWEQDTSQLLITVTQGVEVMGYVVIDSTVGGRSCGGVRLWPDIDEAEMRELARGMTLKFGFLGLPLGGAKAGVRGAPEAPQEERWQRLAAFGRAIAPLLRKRVYLPATDIGTDIGDIRYMLNAVGVPVKRRELRSPRSGYYTAITVFAGVQQATRHVGLSLSGCRVAIEGFGKVGSALAELLDEVNARVVAISTSRGALFNPRGLDVKRLTQLAADAGSRAVDLYTDAERLDHTALLELPVDVLCPCARHGSLHIGNAARVAARIICSGANNPVTPEAEQMLFARGVLCLPCFVTNCGGILGGTMEFAAVSRKQIKAFIERHIGARMAWLLDEAARQQVLPREIAVPLALRHFEYVRRNAAHPALRNRLFETGLELYRRGWIPGRLVASLSVPYFERSLV